MRVVAVDSNQNIKFDKEIKLGHLKGALERNLVTFAHPHLTCAPLVHPKSRWDVPYSTVLVITRIQNTNVIVYINSLYID